tara:strand:- start:274 stop:471 length:198 start_codon:yes stop_codon:yes gene_type:complete
MNNSVTIFLLINSLLIIGLISIQNESKDNNNTQSSTTTSPLEILTWGMVILELILLLIKLKINEI